MSVFIKQGVAGDLQPVARKGLGRVATLYRMQEKELHVTSIRDGNHSDGSLHYDGLAFDFRADGITVVEVKAVLGPDWDVVPSNHGTLHAEYDPS